MKTIILLIIFSAFFFVSCSQIRESAGVNRKNIDEFKIIENPPLVIPPDFNLLPPEQLSEKNIANLESDLAEEILFGLNENNSNDSIEVTTMESIINQTKANEIDNSIRNEINEQFAQEKKSSSRNWENEAEILDSIAESERLRNERLGNNIQDNEDLPTTTIKIEKKKKKRFFFF